jgi:hypothetical protein
MVGAEYKNWIAVVRGSASTPAVRSDGLYCPLADSEGVLPGGWTPTRRLPAKAAPTTGGPGSHRALGGMVEPVDIRIEPEGRVREETS